jgi:threonine/homoserine/homoserine lactone efflux protein
MLALAGGAYVVWTTVKEVNAETAEIDAEKAAKGAKKKDKKA